MAPLLKDDMAVPADPMSLNDNIPAPTVILALPDDILIRQHLGSPTLSGNYMVQVMTTNVPWSQHHHGNGHTMTGQMPLGMYLCGFLQLSLSSLSPFPPKLLALHTQSTYISQPESSRV